MARWTSVTLRYCCLVLARAREHASEFGSGASDYKFISVFAALDAVSANA